MYGNFLRCDRCPPSRPRRPASSAITPVMTAATSHNHAGIGGVCLRRALVHRRSFKTRDEAREHVFRWIEGWYNPRRRHSSLGYLSPIAYEALHTDTESDHPPRIAETRPAQRPSHPRAKGGEANTLTPNGRTAPADPDQPALHQGALIEVGNPTMQNTEVSTEPR